MGLTRRNRCCGSRSIEIAGRYANCISQSLYHTHIDSCMVIISLLSRYQHSFSLSLSSLHTLILLLFSPYHSLIYSHNFMMLMFSWIPVGWWMEWDSLPVILNGQRVTWDSLLQVIPSSLSSCLAIKHYYSMEPRCQLWTDNCWNSFAKSPYCVSLDNPCFRLCLEGNVNKWVFEDCMMLSTKFVSILGECSKGKNSLWSQLFKMNTIMTTDLLV